jgi:pyruvate dehydrogenase E1 component
MAKRRLRIASYNINGINPRLGLFRRGDMPDVSAQAKIASAQKWSDGNKGQHIELGIAESNLFLMLAAAGLSGDLFGQRLFLIGTLYDPSSPAASMRSTTPAIRTRGSCSSRPRAALPWEPEGGAHQSINPPLIALGQPGLRHYEPAYADELAAMMEHAFRLIDDPAGESTYLRLSTRNIRQVERTDNRWRDDALEGGYWLREPGPNAEAAIVAMGEVMPEALASWEELREDVPDLGLLAVTSPDLLHRGWTAAQAARWGGSGTVTSPTSTPPTVSTETQSRKRSRKSY